MIYSEVGGINMQINKTGIISLICGFLGLFLCWNKICIPFILASLICGIISLTDYLGYKWTAICGMALALLGATIVFIRIVLPFIRLSQLSDALAEIPTEQVVVEKEVYATPIQIRTPTPTEVPKPKDAYYIGDTWETDEWKLTLNGVRETDLRNPYSSMNPDALYVVSFTSENKGFYDESLDGLYFLVDSSIVDCTGEMGYAYSADEENYQQSIPIGARITFECGIGVNHRGDFTILISQFDSNEQQHNARFIVNTN